MKISSLLSIISFLTLLAYSATADPFVQTMEEGQDDIFAVGDRNYAIEVMIIEDATPATVTFRINGQITLQMIEHQQFRLRDGILLTIIDIWLNEAGEAGSGDTVTFSLTDYCGDALCGSAETCGSCMQDCGCESGYFCWYGLACEAIRCGDNICSEGETCSEDSCCDGRQMSLIANNAHCGACGNVCKRSEQCFDSVCTSKDKPEELLKKQENKLIRESKDLDQCKTAVVCDDKNPCTVDSCEGSPKKCSSGKQEGCVHGTACLPQTTTTVFDSISYYCTFDNALEPQKNENVACQADYECLSDICREGLCYVERPTFIETILSWFGIDLIKETK